MLIGRPVGEIHPGHVHARKDQRFDALRAAAGGAEGGDDFGTAGDHGSSKIFTLNGVTALYENFVHSPSSLSGTWTLGERRRESILPPPPSPVAPQAATLVGLQPARSSGQDCQ